MQWLNGFPLAPRTMPAASLPSEVRLLRNQALRLDMIGAHRRAEPLLSKVVALIEAMPTHDTCDLVQALNDRARCRFNDGQLIVALGDYRRLVQLLDPRRDSDLISIAAEQVRRCIEGLRLRTATAQLRETIAALVRSARTGRAVHETCRQLRLRTVARRLLARGRIDAGARVMQRWLDEVLVCEISLNPDTMDDLRQHAIALWHLQRPHAACKFFHSLVLTHLRQRPDDSTATAGLLRDWAGCLGATGQHQSARETLALVERMGRPS